MDVTITTRRTEIARQGGRAVAQKYGSEHMRALQKKSWEAQLRKDPLAGERLSKAGLRAIDPAPWNGAWTK